MVRRIVPATAGSARAMPIRTGIRCPGRSSWISSEETRTFCPPASIVTRTAAAVPITSRFGATCFQGSKVISAVSNAFGAANRNFVGHRQAARARAGKDEGPHQGLQFLDRIGRTNIQDQRICLVREVRFDHACRGLSAGGLELPGHARDGMAKRIEYLAVVAATAESPAGVDLRAGVQDRSRAAQGHDKGADGIVVVVFVVVSALEGRPQGRLPRRRTAYENPGVREPAAQTLFLLRPGGRALTGGIAKS